ncbi:glutamate-5-semialdehyde dehydrogenase [Ignatzschineria ureiclastica]|uniref:Gamma-glutamyl phosphate reductase n=1 Tax=Ignatzschineria ureiclastica TaxID=472582 RepID=A0A2U2AFR4_9GAMM|nr:glutamate-5-semialdehyde dehydrogenase [Ignatzschineria ureiclastica]PWD81496.1 glutamate-5-semialdehyde dehydrogenase [Ignatzschineria ureiclastica]GHA01099.1 gamma-glutamyl phosphate reductase [Ignatzschineria ureiclastica]
MSITDYWNELGQKARSASEKLLLANSGQKNDLLQALYDEIISHSAEIEAANRQDIEAAKTAQLDAAFIDRLQLTTSRIEAMAEGVKEMIALPDPVGEMTDIKVRPSGIQVGKMRVPLGVIGIIYESRPNVTIDAAALCLKSGNAAILRGGSEAFHTNQYLATLLAKALEKVGLPAEAVQVINTTDRAIVDLMITSNQYIDVIIPRGGKSLVERINAKATVPVIKHLDGICHTYVDNEADLEKAWRVVDNAKTQRYAPCNTLETLLIHEKILKPFLPEMATILVEKGVEVRACNRALTLLKEHNIPAIIAIEEDWHTEYLAPIIAIKVVKSMEEAITHINHYGSHHTDVILTENYSKATYFLRAVDSACVMINASSRFCDGFEFGLGAEIGISTDKIHVRGPVGLEGLTSQKYIVLGHGEIRTS